MYLVDWWCFSIFENWSYVGNGLEGPAMHSPLVIELYNWRVPCSLERASVIVFILSFTGHLYRGMGLEYTTFLLSLPVLCFLLHIFSWRSCLLLFSCLVMSDPMDWSLPDFSVLKIILATILEWVAISYSKGYSWPMDQTHIFFIGTRQVLVFRSLSWDNCSVNSFSSGVPVGGGEVWLFLLHHLEPNTYQLLPEPCD